VLCGASDEGGGADCTPLHFSAQLGSAIPGQVLDIHFIGRSRVTIVAPP
jgi:hypothetical protein